MKQTELEILLRNHGGLNGLARELGQFDVDEAIVTTAPDTGRTAITMGLALVRGSISASRTIRLHGRRYARKRTRLR